MTDSLLSSFDEQELCSEFPESVRLMIQQLEKENIDWNGVGGLLGMSPTAGVSLKGGKRWRTDLWNGVKAEFADFLCRDSPKYEDLRGEWKELAAKSRHLALASLSGVIGAHMGVAAGVVAPLVVWLMVVAVRIGKEGLCRAIAETPPPDPE